MFSLLVPDIIYSSVFEIMPSQLKKLGIKLALIDLDGTLESCSVPYPSNRTIKWLSSFENHNIKIVIFSNNNDDRVREFCKDLNIPYVSRAKKPLIYEYRKIIEKYLVFPNEIVTIGDQIFTDVFGGNLFGATTIYVKSIDSETPNMKIRGIFEGPFINRRKNMRGDK